MDGVELVLSLSLGVGPTLIQPLSVLVAHQDDDSDDDEGGDDRGEGGDEGDTAVVNVLLLVHLHNGAVGKDLASFAGISWQTSAFKVIFTVHAESVVHTGGGVALVDLDGAVLAGKSGLASADKVVDRVVARSTVLTGITTAIVDVLFAVSSNESGSAVALIVGNKVDAGAAVLARVNLAVVDVMVAVLAGESDRASALVVSSVIGQGASGTVGAWRSSARVDFDVTVDTLEPLRAFADVSSGSPWVVKALSSVLAGPVFAGLGSHFAMASVESKWANASVIANTGSLKKEKETKLIKILFSHFKKPC